MRLFLLSIATVSLLAACTHPKPEVAPPVAHAREAEGHLPIVPLVTLQDLMVSEIDASADQLWDATGTVTTAQGIQVRKPRSDADWAALRKHAVVLLEATNLLLIPGRTVTRQPFRSEGPGVLSSDQIQKHIDGNRDQFNALALGLRAVAQQQLAAIDARDADALLQLGDTMDTVCEACHKVNWYPAEVIPEMPKNPPSISSYQ